MNQIQWSWEFQLRKTIFTSKSTCCKSNHVRETGKNSEILANWGQIWESEKLGNIQGIWKKSWETRSLGLNAFSPCFFEKLNNFRTSWFPSLLCILLILLGSLGILRKKLEMKNSIANIPKSNLSDPEAAEDEHNSTKQSMISLKVVLVLTLIFFTLTIPILLQLLFRVNFNDLGTFLFFAYFAVILIAPSCHFYQKPRHLSLFLNELGFASPISQESA